jgi:hypothetical protein
MTDVIFVGDSFSDDSKRRDLLNLDYLRNITYDYLGLPSTIKPSTFFGLDVINQNKNNIKVHTLGRGSYGNHVISKSLFDKVNEIRKESDEKIYAIIQLSALVRNGVNIRNDIREINIDEFPYDYIPDKNKLTYNDMSEVFNKHFDNIENIDKFCEENNVERLIFFGWSVIYDYDIVTFGLKKKIDKIKSIVTFFPHDETYDEMEAYCTGTKLIKQTNLTPSNKMYLVHPNSFGGMTEYVRDRINVGERYHMTHDAHLSTKSNLLFYNEIIKEWLINQNILDNIEYSNLVKEKIETIIKWEKIRYDALTNSTHNNSGIIREFCFNMITKFRIDLLETEKEFKELNKKLKNII